MFLRNIKCLLFLVLVLLYSCGKAPEKETGWIQYKDFETYTHENPLQVLPDSTAPIELINVDSFDLERPKGVDSWFDGTHILSNNFGDGFVMRIDFDSKSPVTQGSVGEFRIDIGGTDPLIVKRSFAMPSLDWNTQGISFNYYTANQFLKQGGTISFYGVNHEYAISNINIIIQRIHKGDN